MIPRDHVPIPREPLYLPRTVLLAKLLVPPRTVLLAKLLVPPREPLYIL